MRVEGVGVGTWDAEAGGEVQLDRLSLGIEV